MIIKSWPELLAQFLLKFFGILGVMGLVIDYQAWTHTALLDPQRLPEKYVMASVGALVLVFVQRSRLMRRP